MKNYKINIFNEKELKKNYINDLTSIDFFNVENLIFNIYSLKEKKLTITSKIYEKEILTITQDKDFITPDGCLYSAEQISMLDGESNDEIDIDGNIHYIDVSIKKYRKLEKEGVGSIDEKGNDIGYYLSNKDTIVFGNIKAEKIYDELKNLNFDIIGFSGIINPEKQIDFAEGIHKLFSFNVNISNKKDFINKAIILLEGKINIKGYTIKKLKEELLNKIIKLDKKFGTEGKNILVENKKKTSYFKYVLLILYLENKINIVEYNQEIEYFVDILNFSEEEGLYFNENNGDITNNGKHIGNIKISTQEYKLFKYLYKNKGELKTYDDIFKKLNGGKTEKDKSKYLADIKNRISKEIKNLIKNIQGKGYFIP